MLLGILAASIIGIMVAGKGFIRVGEGKIRACEGKTGAAQDF